MEFGVAQVEDFFRIGAPGGGVADFVVELDGGAGGVAVGVDGHGVEEVVHDEGHLFAVGGVDGAVFGAGGDGFEGGGGEELLLAGC